MEERGNKGWFRVITETQGKKGRKLQKNQGKIREKENLKEFRNLSQVRLQNL